MIKKELKNIKCEEDLDRLVDETKFTIKAKKGNTIDVDLQGCTPGVVYKMTLVLAEFVKMGILKKDDINQIFRSLKKVYPRARALAKYGNELNIKPTPTLVELPEHLGKELYQKIKLVELGEMDEDDIDYDYYINEAEKYKKGRR